MPRYKMFLLLKSFAFCFSTSLSPQYDRAKPSTALQSPRLLVLLKRPLHSEHAKPPFLPSFVLSKKRCIAAFSNRGGGLDGRPFLGFQRPLNDPAPIESGGPLMASFFSASPPPTLHLEFRGGEAEKKKRRAEQGHRGPLKTQNRPSKGFFEAEKQLGLYAKKRKLGSNSFLAIPTLAPIHKRPKSAAESAQVIKLKGSILTDLPFWNQCFDKNRLKNFVLWFLVTYGEYRTVELIEQFKNIGFEYATKAGISLGIDDLKIPVKKSLLILEAEKMTNSALNQYNRGEITGVERFQKMIDTWHRTSEVLKQEVIENFELTNTLNPVYMMAFSGARGNISQVRQLVGMRGLMANPQGQILDFPIRSNFREGLSLTEYIISTYGARKGIVDTALRTANAGYLTRRLVDVAQHVIVSNFDCGTYKGIFLNDMKEGNKVLYSLQNRLIGRVLGKNVFSRSSRHNQPLLEKEMGGLLQKGVRGKLQKDSGALKKVNCLNQAPVSFRNTEISIDLAMKLCKISNKIFVRSSLTCETQKSVCQLCYGWSLAQGNLVSIGEAVGVVAAQSVGEPGTQLTMRTFHTGGVFTGDVTDQVKALYNGFVKYLNPIAGTLIRTPEGKIAFLTKTEGFIEVLSNSRGAELSSAKQGPSSLGQEPFIEPLHLPVGVRRNAPLGFPGKIEQQLNKLGRGRALQEKKKIYKIPSYTLLFVRQGENVFEKQVIAQISNISLLDPALSAPRISVGEVQMGLTSLDKQNASKKSSTYLKGQQNKRDDAEFTINSEIEGEFYSVKLNLLEKNIGAKLPLRGPLQKNSSGGAYEARPSRNLVPDALRDGEEEVVLEACDWGYAWILAGKVYQLPLLSRFFPHPGDFLNRKSLMNQIQLKATNNGGNFGFLETKFNDNLILNKPVFFLEINKMIYNKIGYLFTLPEYSFFNIGFLDSIITKSKLVDFFFSPFNYPFGVDKEHKNFITSKDILFTPTSFLSLASFPYSKGSKHSSLKPYVTHPFIEVVNKKGQEKKKSTHFSHFNWTQTQFQNSSANWSQNLSLFLEWFPHSKIQTSGAFLSNSKTLQALAYTPSMWSTKTTLFYSRFQFTSLFKNQAKLLKDRFIKQPCLLKQRKEVLYSLKTNTKLGLSRNLKKERFFISIYGAARFIKDTKSSLQSKAFKRQTSKFILHRKNKPYYDHGKLLFQRENLYKNQYTKFLWISRQHYEIPQEKFSTRGNYSGQIPIPFIQKYSFKEAEGELVTPLVHKERAFLKNQKSSESSSFLKLRVLPAFNFLRKNFEMDPFQRSQLGSPPFLKSWTKNPKSEHTVIADYFGSSAGVQTLFYKKNRQGRKQPINFHLKDTVQIAKIAQPTPVSKKRPLAYFNRPPQLRVPACKKKFFALPQIKGASHPSMKHRSDMQEPPPTKTTPVMIAKKRGLIPFFKGSPIGVDSFSVGGKKRPSLFKGRMCFAQFSVLASFGSNIFQKIVFTKNKEAQKGIGAYKTKIIRPQKKNSQTKQRHKKKFSFNGLYKKKIVSYGTKNPCFLVFKNGSQASVRRMVIQNLLLIKKHRPLLIPYFSLSAKLFLNDTKPSGIQKTISILYREVIKPLTKTKSNFVVQKKKNKGLFLSSLRPASHALQAISPFASRKGRLLLFSREGRAWALMASPSFLFRRGVRSKAIEGPTPIKGPLSNLKGTAAFNLDQRLTFFGASSKPEVSPLLLLSTSILLNRSTRSSNNFQYSKIAFKNRIALYPHHLNKIRLNGAAQLKKLKGGFDSSFVSAPKIGPKTAFFSKGLKKDFAIWYQDRQGRNRKSSVRTTFFIVYLEGFLFKKTSPTLQNFENFQMTYGLGAPKKIAHRNQGRKVQAKSSKSFQSNNCIKSIAITSKKGWLYFPFSSSSFLHSGCSNPPDITQSRAKQLISFPSKGLKQTAPRFAPTKGRRALLCSLDNSFKITGQHQNKNRFESLKWQSQLEVLKTNFDSDALISPAKRKEEAHLFKKLLRRALLFSFLLRKKKSRGAILLKFSKNNKKSVSKIKRLGFSSSINKQRASLLKRSHKPHSFSPFNEGKQITKKYPKRHSNAANALSKKKDKTPLHGQKNTSGLLKNTPKKYSFINFDFKAAKQHQGLISPGQLFINGLLFENNLYVEWLFLNSFPFLKGLLKKKIVLENLHFHNISFLKLHNKRKWVPSLSERERERKPITQWQIREQETLKSVFKSKAEVNTPNFASWVKNAKCRFIQHDLNLNKGFLTATHMILIQRALELTTHQAQNYKIELAELYKSSGDSLIRESKEFLISGLQGKGLEVPTANKYNTNLTLILATLLQTKKLSESPSSLLRAGRPIKILNLGNTDPFTKGLTLKEKEKERASRPKPIKISFFSKKIALWQSSKNKNLNKLINKKPSLSIFVKLHKNKSYNSLLVKSQLRWSFLNKQYKSNPPIIENWPIPHLDFKVKSTKFHLHKLSSLTGRSINVEIGTVTPLPLGKREGANQRSQKEGTISRSNQGGGPIGFAQETFFDQKGSMALRTSLEPFDVSQGFRTPPTLKESPTNWNKFKGGTLLPLKAIQNTYAKDPGGVTTRYSKVRFEISPTMQIKENTPPLDSLFFFRQGAQLQPLHLRGKLEKKRPSRGRPPTMAKGAQKASSVFIKGDPSPVLRETAAATPRASLITAQWISHVYPSVAKENRYPLGKKNKLQHRSIIIFKKPININPLLIGYNSPYGSDLDFNIPNIHLNAKLHPPGLRKVRHGSAHTEENLNLSLSSKKQSAAWLFNITRRYGRGRQSRKLAYLFAQPCFSFFLSKKLPSPCLIRSRALQLKTRLNKQKLFFYHRKTSKAWCLLVENKVKKVVKRELILQKLSSRAKLSCRASNGQASATLLRTSLKDKKKMFLTLYSNGESLYDNKFISSNPFIKSSYLSTFEGEFVKALPLSAQSLALEGQTTFVEKGPNSKKPPFIEKKEGQNQQPMPKATVLLKIKDSKPQILQEFKKELILSPSLVKKTATLNSSYAKQSEGGCIVLTKQNLICFLFSSVSTKENLSFPLLQSFRSERSFAVAFKFARDNLSKEMASFCKRSLHNIFISPLDCSNSFDSFLAPTDIPEASEAPQGGSLPSLTPVFLQEEKKRTGVLPILEGSSALERKELSFAAIRAGSSVRLLQSTFTEGTLQNDNIAAWMLNSASHQNSNNSISKKMQKVFKIKGLVTGLQKGRGRSLYKNQLSLGEFFVYGDKIMPPTLLHRTLLPSSAPTFFNSLAQFQEIPKVLNKQKTNEFFENNANFKKHQNNSEGIAIPTSGQIIHIGIYKITLRRAQPIFISPKSILHIADGSFVLNNDPVMTLTYQRLKTGDIVQGIPKVEQYLEARITKQGRLFRDCLPNLLKGLFKRYRCQLPLERAVRQSFYKIQQIIVDGVLRVYRSQGVTIADKHLEVIVKQMTSKVKIINGAQTGFFPGEIIDLQFVERVNLSLMKKIQYEPLILGITRAALEVDSFLSAASFQQTTRVLSSSAIEKRKDFLKGLKENILLGNLMPAGTGYLVYLEDICFLK